MGKRYFITTESVTEGHPDKVADYISDSILDECLKQDRNSRVAIETILSKDKVSIAGQITSNAKFDIEELVRNKLKEVGYDDAKINMDYRTCIIDTNISKQSNDIAINNKN
jgi:S-adenosylmethionine synthetase